MKKFSDWLMVLLGSSLCLGAMPITGGKSIGGFSEGLAIFGEENRGLRLGFYLGPGGEFDTASTFAFVCLKNSGTNDIFLSRGGPSFGMLTGSSATGGSLAFIDSRDLSIVFGDGFVPSPPFVLKAGAVSAQRFNLSRHLRATSAGRFYLLVSTRLKISETVPARAETLEEIELVSGAVEFDVPSSLVSSTNAGWPPSSAVAMPFETSFIDPSIAGTAELRESIQRANESTINFFRQRWPHLLGEAPLNTNATNMAITPSVSIPIAEVEAGDAEASRWWIAGAVVAAASLVGFGVVRRARRRSRD